MNTFFTVYCIISGFLGWHVLPKLVEKNRALGNEIDASALFFAVLWVSFIWPALIIRAVRNNLK
jgi:hypothetical protein